MDQVCQKIVVRVEDLEPAVHEGPGVECAQKNRTRKKVYADHSRGVPHQYHCPVAGCIYDTNSERSFSCIKYLRQHYHKIHAAKLFFCERCKKGFAKPAELTAHLHSCGSTFTCSCGYAYSTRAALLTHAKRKMHTLPREQQTGFRKAPKANHLGSPTTQIHLRGKRGDFITPPTVIIFVNGNADLSSLKQANGSSSSNCEQSLQKPCFILPKPAPLDALSAQAIAAVALSELSAGLHVPKAASVGVQTAGQEGPCHCRNPTDEDVTMCSAETQTPVSTECKPGMSNAQATQTDNPVGLSSTATQTLPDMFEHDMFGNGQAYSFSSGAAGWPLAEAQSLPLPESPTFALANDKFSQTMEDLGVSVNFPMCGAVSSSTQTSPGCSRLATQSTDQLLRCYLGMDNLDYAVDSPGESVRHLSSQTQTERRLDALFLAPGSDSDPEDEAASLSTNIHTQTSAEDLESITLQLLSNMETQTSDSFLFPDLSGLCDIQTQTAQDGSPSLVDTHTQTHRDGLLGFAAPQINMETQTFLSFLEGGDAALTDSHTQTSTSIMALLDYCSGSEDA